MAQEKWEKFTVIIPVYQVPLPTHREVTAQAVAAVRAQESWRHLKVSSKIVENAIIIAYVP